MKVIRALTGKGQKWGVKNPKTFSFIYPYSKLQIHATVSENYFHSIAKWLINDVFSQ